MNVNNFYYRLMEVINKLDSTLEVLHHVVAKESH